MPAEISLVSSDSALSSVGTVPALSTTSMSSGISASVDWGSATSNSLVKTYAKDYNEQKKDLDTLARAHGTGVDYAGPLVRTQFHWTDMLPALMIPLVCFSTLFCGANLWGDCEEAVISACLSITLWAASAFCTPEKRAWVVRSANMVIFYGGLAVSGYMHPEAAGGMFSWRELRFYCMYSWVACLWFMYIQIMKLDAPDSQWIGWKQLSSMCFPLVGFLVTSPLLWAVSQAASAYPEIFEVVSLGGMWSSVGDFVPQVACAWIIMTFVEHFLEEFMRAKFKLSEEALSVSTCLLKFPFAEEFLSLLTQKIIGSSKFQEDSNVFLYVGVCILWNCGGYLPTSVLVLTCFTIALYNVWIKCFLVDCLVGVIMAVQKLNTDRNAALRLIECNHSVFMVLVCSGLFVLQIPNTIGACALYIPETTTVGAVIHAFPFPAACFATMVLYYVISNVMEAGIKKISCMWFKPIPTTLTVPAQVPPFQKQNTTRSLDHKKVLEKSKTELYNKIHTPRAENLRTVVMVGKKQIKKNKELTGEMYEKHVENNHCMDMIFNVVLTCSVMYKCLTCCFFGLVVLGMHTWVVSATNAIAYVGVKFDGDSDGYVYSILTCVLVGSAINLVVWFFTIVGGAVTILALTVVRNHSVRRFLLGVFDMTMSSMTLDTPFSRRLGEFTVGTQSLQGAYEGLMNRTFLHTNTMHQLMNCTRPDSMMFLCDTEAFKSKTDCTKIYLAIGRDAVNCNNSKWMVDQQMECFKCRIVNMNAKTQVAESVANALNDIHTHVTREDPQSDTVRAVVCNVTNETPLLKTHFPALCPSANKRWTPATAEMCVAAGVMNETAQGEVARIKEVFEEIVKVRSAYYSTLGEMLNNHTRNVSVGKAASEATKMAMLVTATIHLGNKMYPRSLMPSFFGMGDFLTIVDNAAFAADAYMVNNAVKELTDGVYLEYLSNHGFNDSYIAPYLASAMKEMTTRLTQPEPVNNKKAQENITNDKKAQENITNDKKAQENNITVNKTDAKDPVNKTNTKKPVNKTDTNEPVNKTDTKEPVNKTAPEQPVNKTAPEQPVNKTAPEQPVNKTAPEQPVNMTDAKEPVNKTAPEQPVNDAKTGQNSTENATAQENIPETTVADPETDEDEVKDLCQYFTYGWGSCKSLAFKP